MINFYFYRFLIILVLIFQNILLLNEETLILCCFIIFCWLGYNNVGDGIKSYFNKSREKIKLTIYSSIKNTEISLKTLLSTRTKFWYLLIGFRRLGNHFLNFTNNLIDWSFINNTNFVTLLFPKRLDFSTRVEFQLKKLITLLLIKNLQRTVTLKYFCINEISNSHFRCLHRINTLNAIRAVHKI